MIVFEEHPTMHLYKGNRKIMAENDCGIRKK
jgi:hypothetical protein